jgi:hypothetical protein
MAVMSKALAKTVLEIDQSELYALTEEMLDRFPYERVAERIEQVREYAELHELYPEMEAYEEELIEGIVSLARSAALLGESGLEDRLTELLDGIM